MSISLRVTEQESEVSEYIRRTVMERIENEFDIQCYNAAKAEYEENPATCTTEELAKELGIEL